MITFPIKCKQTNESVYTLKEYYRTRHWQTVKKAYGSSKEPKCCYICAKKERLNLYHKSYKRIGREKPEDLLPLCHTHYKAISDQMTLQQTNESNLWSMAKKMKSFYHDKKNKNKDIDFLWW